MVCEIPCFFVDFFMDENSRARVIPENGIEKKPSVFERPYASPLV
jgi:hypothetical protein